MDQVMVDVTHLDSVEPGDEVVLIRRADLAAKFAQER
jgi:alanine racemase